MLLFPGFNAQSTRIDCFTAPCNRDPKAVRSDLEGEDPKPCVVNAFGD